MHYNFLTKLATPIPFASMECPLLGCQGLAPQIKSLFETVNGPGTERKSCPPALVDPTPAEPPPSGGQPVAADNHHPFQTAAHSTGNQS